jgi:hypothetical protein
METFEHSCQSRAEKKMFTRKVKFICGGRCKPKRGAMRRLIILAFVGAVVATTVGYRPLAAQLSQPGAANAPYMTPRLADIMNGTQWRHLKLAYSGQQSNWQLANYELGQIRQSLSTAAQRYPVFKGVPVARLIKEESEPPLADLGKTIESKNRADFTESFVKLTEACNRCHQAAGVGFIVMRTPTASPFSNQVFSR